MPTTPFDPVPSATRVPAVVVRAVPTGSEPAPVLGVPVRTEGEVPTAGGLSREALAAWGFSGTAGQTLVLPREEGAVVAVGVGAQPSPADLRDATAAFARAAARESRLASRAAARAN